MFSKIDLRILRDRDTSVQPRILAQQKRTLELKRMAISLYAMGTSTRDVITIIEELDGFDMDPSYISKITKQWWPKIEEFQTRKLDKFILWFCLMKLDLKQGKKEFCEMFLFSLCLVIK